VDEKTRAWVYRVGAVLIAVLIVVDVVTGGDAATWATWVASVIGLGAAGLAAANTTTNR
jgi:predicted membrane channel-forming protein YqfA (hemolysin III family)